MGTHQLCCRRRETRLTSPPDVNGFIVVDLPPEEAASFHAELQRNELSLVPLLTPASPVARLQYVMWPTNLQCVHRFFYQSCKQPRFVVRLLRLGEWRHRCEDPGASGKNLDIDLDDVMLIQWGDDLIDEQKSSTSSSSVAAFLERCRSVTSCPLALGFGISRREQFLSAEAAGADAVVIGSAILRVIESADVGCHVQDVSTFITEVIGSA